MKEGRGEPSQVPDSVVKHAAVGLSGSVGSCRDAGSNGFSAETVCCTANGTTQKSCVLSPHPNPFPLSPTHLTFQALYCAGSSSSALILLFLFSLQAGRAEPVGRKQLEGRSV